MTTYHTVDIDGVEIFYRQAGSADKPVLILLHGFPSASHMFRDLIPVLEEHFLIIAPDYPGFGNSASPERTDFEYTFDHIADVMERLIAKLNLTKYALFVFDYGAPIGFRIAMRHPEQITAIISQNGNVYREGLGRNGPRERSIGITQPKKREKVIERPLPQRPLNINMLMEQRATWSLQTATRLTARICLDLGMTKNSWI